MTYRNRPRAPGSGSRAMMGGNYDPSGHAARNTCFSARCWNAGAGSCRAQLLRRARGSRDRPGSGGDVAHRGRELVVLVVERARRGRQTEHAGTRAEGGRIFTSGGRVLCAVGLGASVSQSQHEAYALVDAISWQGMQCRRDIGYRAVAREKDAGSPRP